MQSAVSIKGANITEVTPGVETFFRRFSENTADPQTRATGNKESGEKSTVMRCCACVSGMMQNPDSG